ncbi:hypothetical protein [Dictyobacter arantiisoli]|uniref:Uncharacterized protein n=1 Tax=Dictyobacter arantiisoli TaxID=2014874 RepID=A0A5A5TD15_9CHLR|nr:hypothetical protein [Dictyobacter arantiisoli]GCF09237.1 hypothetical protein KDI_28010 [Dictyobacter arantiisoli]
MEAGATEEEKDSVHTTVNVDTTLSTQQIYQHDPLLILLKGKLHLNNLWISAGATLLPGSVYLLAWLLWRVNEIKEWDNKDLLSLIIQTFILFPFLSLIYTLIPNAIVKLFNTLATNGVIGHARKDRPGGETYAAFKQQLVYWIDNSWWTVAITIVVVLYILTRLFLRELPAQNNPIPYPLRAIVIIAYAPLMFATGMSVIRLVIVLIFTNRLFYFFTLQIQPIHPDGSGGLGILESLLWLCVGMMLWVVTLLIAMILVQKLSGLSYAEMFLLGAIYIALIPTLLIGWLIFPHRMMVQARNEALQPLMVEYQHALIQSLSSGTQDTQSIAAETLHLETLKKRYDLVYNLFPVWPLDTNTLSRAGATVIIPIILPLILPSTLSFISFLLQKFGL